MERYEMLLLMLFESAESNLLKLFQSCLWSFRAFEFQNLDKPKKI